MNHPNLDSRVALLCSALTRLTIKIHRDCKVWIRKSDLCRTFHCWIKCLGYNNFEHFFSIRPVANKILFNKISSYSIQFLIPLLLKPWEIIQKLQEWKISWWWPIILICMSYILLHCRWLWRYRRFYLDKQFFFPFLLEFNRFFRK